MVGNESVDMFLARLAGRVVGMATLVTFPIPMGVRGHIDDVVVDEATRGRGIARALLDPMVARAQGLGGADPGPHVASSQRIRDPALRGFRIRAA